MRFYNLVKDKIIIFKQSKRDSQNVIQLSNVYHGKNKHVDIRYHFSKEASENDIEIRYLKSERILTDILIKALPRVKHEKCIKMINLKYEYETDNV